MDVSHPLPNIKEKRKIYKESSKDHDKWIRNFERQTIVFGWIKILTLVSLVALMIATIIKISS